MKKLILICLIVCSSVVYASNVFHLPGISSPIHELTGFEAYSNPSGIYIGREMMGFINDPSQIYAIIAHEQAHITLRHSEKQLAGMNSYCSKDLSFDQCQRIYELTHLVELQQDEKDADTLSLTAIKGYGYDSTVCNLFTKLETKYGKMDNPISTHPSLQWRYNNCLSIME